MKKLIPLVFLLVLSCNKDEPLSGKIELSKKLNTSVGIKNGTGSTIDLKKWKLVEVIPFTPTSHEFRWGGTTPIPSGSTHTLTAASLGFDLSLISIISLYDSNSVLIVTK